MRSYLVYLTLNIIFSVDVRCKTDPIKLHEYAKVIIESVLENHSSSICNNIFENCRQFSY
jgi:hypothetical protein